MTKARDLISLIENDLEAPATGMPSLQDQQCELLHFIKQSFEKAIAGKQSLDSFHIQEGVRCMLTPEAERLHKDIENLVKSIVGDLK